MLNTLQNAEKALLNAGFFVRSTKKLFLRPSGIIEGSLIFLEISIASKYLDAYMRTINRLLTDGYKIIHFPEISMLRISCIDPKYQHIANQIENSNYEQLDAVQRMIEQHFPEDPILVKMIAERCAHLKKDLV